MSLALFTLLACTERLPEPELVQLQAHQELLIQDVSVFVGDGSELLLSQDVWVRDGVVAAVRPTGDALPEGAERVSGQGSTLMPGLVDFHTHVGSSTGAPWRRFAASPELHLQQWLYAGVTTVVDQGGLAPALLKLEQKVLAGALPGPRMYITNMAITAPDGHPIPGGVELLGPPAKLAKGLIPQADTPDKARALVQKIAAMPGVDHVKVIYDSIPDAGSHLSLEVLQAIVEEGHRLQRPVYVHVGSAQDAVEVAESGADLMAHGPYQSALSPDQVQRIAASGVAVVYTGVAFELCAQAGQGALQASEFERQFVPEPMRQVAEGEVGARILEYPVVGEMARTCAEHLGSVGPNILALHKAGVPMLMGSDAAFHGIWPGAALQRELAFQVRAGVSPAAVLRGATGLAAETLGATDWGQVKQGQAADLLMVRGDPLQDISAMTQIELVLKGGQRVKRAPIP